MPRSKDLRSDRGATLVEYSLLVALISVVSIGALSLLSDSSAAAFDDASEAASGGDVSSGESGPSDPGPGDPGPGDPGPSDPGPADPGPGDPGPGDPGPSDPGDEPEEQDEPPQVSSSFLNSSASRNGNSPHWTAEADLLITGSDGQPLAGSVEVEVRVIERGENWRGGDVEYTSTRTIQIFNGTGSISDTLKHQGWFDDEITSISYQVVGVSGGSGVEWDGTSPTITILEP